MKTNYCLGSIEHLSILIDCFADVNYCTFYLMTIFIVVDFLLFLTFQVLLDQPHSFVSKVFFELSCDLEQRN